MGRARFVSAGRINALFDGLVAIAITMMVLNLGLPADSSRESIAALAQSIGVFFVTFIVVAYQWNHHQRLMDGVERVSGKVVWATLSSLFFISLMPLFTKWIIQHPTEMVPALGYDIVFLCAEMSFRAVAVFLVRDGSIAFGGDGRHAFERDGHVESWLHFIVRIAVFIAAIAVPVALFMITPAFSLVMFMAFPVLSSLIEAFSERREEERSDRRRRADAFAPSDETFAAEACAGCDGRDGTHVKTGGRDDMQRADGAQGDTPGVPPHPGDARRSRIRTR